MGFKSDWMGYNGALQTICNYFASEPIFTQQYIHSMEATGRFRDSFCGDMMAYYLSPWFLWLIWCTLPKSIRWHWEIPPKKNVFDVKILRCETSPFRCLPDDLHIPQPIGSMYAIIYIYMLTWMGYIDGKCYHIWQGNRINMCYCQRN